MEIAELKKQKADRIFESTRDSMARLKNHPVYGKLTTMDDVRTFMKYHAFAVWDFMSLAKALQCHFAPVKVPWFAPLNSDVARFVNEIILEEETDVDFDGNYKSHFSMYLDAMREIGAPTELIEGLINELKNGLPVLELIRESNLPDALKKFLGFTFETIETGSVHQIAAAFTYGREDIIPDMFLKVLEGSSELVDAPRFKYYLKRHISLDGDRHGPMAHRLMESVCGEDDTKWEEAAITARRALETRIDLWSFVSENLA